MKAKTIQGNDLAEIKSALSASMTDGFKPTMAIVFMSISQDRDGICNLLTGQQIDIFGSTTSGEFISSDLSEKGIVMMLLDIDRSYYKIAWLQEGDQSTPENARRLGAEGRKLFEKAAFIIASGWVHADGDRIAEGIEEGFGGAVPIFGGMAGDDLALSGPIVFTNDKSSIHGLVAIIIDESKIEISGIATCGWKAVGTPRTITKSEGNIVYTIDHQPALDTVMKYLGVEVDLESSENTVTQIGAYYPLQLERTNTAPVMRTAMFANKLDHSLICAGNVPQGSQVRFSLPPDFDVIDKVVAECTELKRDVQSEADAVIMFSCISRHLSFGILISEEIEQVQKVWNAPMVGFFCYGEFGKAKGGKHEFHNNTCCVVALKEK